MDYSRFPKHMGIELRTNHEEHGIQGTSGSTDRQFLTSISKTVIDRTPSPMAFDGRKGPQAPCGD